MQEQRNTTSAIAPDCQRGINPPPRTRRRIVPVNGSEEPAAVGKRKRRVTFKKADVARAISAVTKGGLVPASVEIGSDGNIRIYAAGMEPAETLFDQWSDRL